MSETYQKHIVSVNGSGTVSIPFEWSDPSEVYVYCYGSVGPYTGTLAGMIANGWVSLLGAAGGDVLTHFQAGQRVWMVLSRQTALDSYSSLRDLLKAIDELRAEIQCTFRVPDVFLPVLAAFPATERKGKALVFDDNGNPALGDVAGGDVKTARDETLQAASDVKARAEQTAESVEDAKQWALKSADAYSRLVSAADAILKATDDAVVGCKQEIQRLLNNADVAGSERLRELQLRFEQYVATLGQAVSSASAQWDALLSGAMTSISEARETSVLNVESSRESALNAMGVELNHSLRVIRECVEAYGLELKNQTKTMLDELREVYSQEWADSAKQWATKFSDLEKSIESRLQWSDVRSGIQTQSILGWDEISNKATSNAMYFDGFGIRAISQGADVLFPVKGGTLALLSDVDEKLGDISSDTFALRENGTIKSPTILEGKASSLCSIPVAEVPENADNASYDAFLGTLNSVGIVGESIIPTTLSFYRRNANGYVDTDVPRFLQIRRRDANGNWYIAYNSSNGLAPNSFLLAGDEMKWILFEVAGGPIPDDEVISITETDDEAGTNLVSWGAKATRIYGGGIASGAEIIESNRASHAPLLKMDFYLLSDIATKGDVEAVELLKADLIHSHEMSDVNGLEDALDGKTSLQYCVTGDVVSNEKFFGYKGPMSRFGVYGRAIVYRLGIVVGGAAAQFSDIPLWARVICLKGSTWTLVSQSKTPRKWNEVSVGDVLEFDMEYVGGGHIPDDGDTIAIVFVENPEAAADLYTSFTLQFGCSATMGGFNKGLGSSAIAPFSPVFHLTYASYPGNMYGRFLTLGGGTLTGGITLPQYTSGVSMPNSSWIRAVSKGYSVVDVGASGSVSGTFDSFVVNEALSVLPLGTKTAAGVDAYGLHVSATGGLQLFGTHFMLGTVWDGQDSGLMPGLKIVNNNLSMYSDDAASLGFDYANRVSFRTMPNDGYEATYGFEAWEWSDDTHTVKQPTAGVKLLKPSQKSALVPTSVLNMEEGDARWAAKSDLDAKANSTDVVMLSGTQSITGYKSFISMSASTAQIASVSVGFMKGYFPGVTNPPAWFQQVNSKTNVIDVTTLKQGGVAINDLFVSKSDYDALLARVEALEAGSPGSGVTPTLSFPVGAADGTKWDSEVASASQNGTTVTLSAFPAAGGSYVVRVYGVDRTTLTASSEAEWLSEFMTNGSVFWDDDLNHGYVAFTVAWNSESYDRTATIRLVSSALPGEQYSIVVLQNGAAYGAQ